MSTPGVVAYVAAVLPARSETFVYREVVALRKRGWKIETVSLRAPDPGLESELGEVCAGVTVVYDAEFARSLAAELAAHPVRSAQTLAVALGDAAQPGEPLSLRTRGKPVAQALAGISLSQRLRAKRVRHIHCHFAHAPTTLGMYAAAQLGISFSFTGHANDLFQRRVLLRRKLERASFVSCISEWHREFYQAVASREPARRAIVRCGVDVASWVPVAARPDRGRPLQALTVARLVRKKGIDVLLRALATLTRNVELTVAGDGPERDALTALCRELGCENRVKWLGAVDNETVRSLMQQADVFVLPCRQDEHGDKDGIPVVLMEAMACGLPVISGDLPTIRELVEPGVSGYLVPGNDPSALAAALEQLTDELRAQVGRAARARVEAEFSLDANVERLERELHAAMTSESMALGRDRLDAGEALR